MNGTIERITCAVSLVGIVLCLILLAGEPVHAAGYDDALRWSNSAKQSPTAEFERLQAIEQQQQIMLRQQRALESARMRELGDAAFDAIMGIRVPDTIDIYRAYNEGRAIDALEDIGDGIDRLGRGRNGIWVPGFRR